jgi:hypothetical protein
LPHKAARLLIPANFLENFENVLKCKILQSEQSKYFFKLQTALIKLKKIQKEVKICKICSYCVSNAVER